MRIQQVNQSDGDKIFMAAQNVSTETLSKGYAMCCDTATFNGNRLTKPATAVLNLFVGLNANTIAVQVNDYFEVQVYGAFSSARIIQDTTAAGSVAVGSILVPTDADWNLKLAGATAVGAVGLVVAAAAVATATVTAGTATGKVWLRAMALLVSAGLFSGLVA